MRRIFSLPKPSGDRSFALSESRLAAIVESSRIDEKQVAANFILQARARHRHRPRLVDTQQRQELRPLPAWLSRGQQSR
jgi:hypothetical protein